MLHSTEGEPPTGAKPELPARLPAASAEYRGNATEPRLTMSEALREVLRAHMSADSRVTLLGEDLEDPKGDVLGVTRGLTALFPGRVLNTALNESTIVGASIGRALAGGRPVAFLQFADFLPLAFNQIIGELSSMYWRTKGNWQCPVIVMVCGSYRPGPGSFHAQTLESMAAHVPGIDVMMPSTAADAAGLLNAAFESQRPTLFFYPQVCLNDADRSTSCDVVRQLVPIGKARRVRRGSDLTLVSWGSTMPLCEDAAAVLAAHGLEVDLIDLRSISPWDHECVRDSVEQSGRLLVVHEGNLTCGFGAEVLARTAEAVRRPIACRRVARADTYVPGNFSNQLEVLPSFKAILTAAAEMLDWELSWDTPTADAEKVSMVEARATPRLRRRSAILPSVIALPPQGPAAPRVGLSTVYAIHGADQRTNAQLTAIFPGRTEEEIARRTGIESRNYLRPEESILTIALAAARQALVGEQLRISDLSAIICSTTTPLATTPSTACRVLHALCREDTHHEIPAHDVNAACTGYLYALAAGFDLLCVDPQARVLVITTEAMSRVVNPNDFGTSILFGDAASATILYGPREMHRARWTLARPVVSARGESGDLLTVENPGCGFLKMAGRKVFSEAVVTMSAMLERACAASALHLGDLQLIVPHQANGRIIEAIRERLDLLPEQIYTNIRRHGNTSSSSIPLCLAELCGRVAPADRVGLCAFGGGFTFGAAILQMRATSTGANSAQRNCA